MKRSSNNVGHLGKRITFLTGHTPGGYRKASILALAEACAGSGHEVNVVRVGGSRLRSLLKGTKHPRSLPLNARYPIATRMTGFSYQPLVHPFNVPIGPLKMLMWPLFALYPVSLPRSGWEMLEDRDVVVCESGLGLLFIPLIARRHPNTRLIYSVSDRLRTLNAHPLLLKAERRALPRFSLIRVPAQAMVADYAGWPVKHIPHGIDRMLFDREHPTPFEAGRNAVVIGDMLFDPDIVERIAAAYPHWMLHLIGRRCRLKRALPNVIEHGEKPFAETVAFIKHAEVGIAPYAAAPDADYLSQSSLKMIQYGYCRLPVVAPDFVRDGHANVLAYDPARPESAVEAFGRAMACDRDAFGSTSARDWREVAEAILAEAGRPGAGA